MRGSRRFHLADVTNDEWAAKLRAYEAPPRPNATPFAFQSYEWSTRLEAYENARAKRKARGRSAYFSWGPTWFERIYFVQAGTDGPIKIGCTEREMDERLYDLSRAPVVQGRTLRVLAVVPGTRKDEAWTLAKFSHLAIGGEWHRPGEDLLAFVAGLGAAVFADARAGVAGDASG